MSKQEKDMERIHRALRGQLEEGEQEQLKEQLQEAAFQQDYQVEAQVYTELKQREDKRLKKLLQQTEEQQTMTPARPPGQRLFYPVLVAAGILLLLSLAWWWNHSSAPETIFAELFEPHPNTYRPTLRAVNNEQAVMDKGFLAYDREAFALAAATWQQLSDTSLTDPVRLFWANSLLAEGDLRGAGDLLATISEPSWQAEAGYYLGLIALAKGETTAGRKRLTGLLENEQLTPYLRREVKEALRFSE